MSNQAREIYALSLNQIATAIYSNYQARDIGKVSIVVEGHMGTGKSSLLTMVQKLLPDHIACYCDCTTKDLGDLTIPNIGIMDDKSKFVTFVTNEELGMHLNKPIILMIDEYGKANTAVKNAMNRVLLEGKLGSYTLHEDSVVFATTNLGAEGVGDLLLPHHRNRISVIQSRKPDAEEWCAWGVNNDIDVALLGFCQDSHYGGMLFQSFQEVSDPDKNKFIYHPKAVGRTAFVTPRSLELASNWLRRRHMFDETTLTALLIGTIGAPAATELMAFISVANDLPRLDEIKNDPANAPIPTSNAALVMTVYRTLAVLDRSWVDSWITYLNRLEPEAQGYFAQGVRDPSYEKQSIVYQSAGFRDWAVEHGYMFSADQ
jgi:hypothetical protein